MVINGRPNARAPTACAGCSSTPCRCGVPADRRQLAGPAAPGLRRGTGRHAAPQGAAEPGSAAGARRPATARRRSSTTSTSTACPATPGEDRWRWPAPPSPSRSTPPRRLQHRRTAPAGSNPPTVEAFADVLREVVTDLLADPEAPAGRPDLPPPPAARRSATAPPARRCPTPPRAFPEAVREHARRTPGAVAVDHGDQRLTYAELDAARQPARPPAARAGRRPGHAGRRLPAAAAPTWCAPCSPSRGPAPPTCRSTRDYPADRLAFMLADARRAALLTQAPPAGTVPGRAACCARQTPPRRRPRPAPRRRRRPRRRPPTSSTPPAPPAGPRACGHRTRGLANLIRARSATSGRPAATACCSRRRSASTSRSSNCPGRCRRRHAWCIAAAATTPRPARPRPTWPRAPASPPSSCRAAALATCCDGRALPALAARLTGGEACPAGWPTLLERRPPRSATATARPRPPSGRDLRRVHRRRRRRRPPIGRPIANTRVLRARRRPAPGAAPACPASCTSAARAWRAATWAGPR